MAGDTTVCPEIGAIDVTPLSAFDLRSQAQRRLATFQIALVEKAQSPRGVFLPKHPAVAGRHDTLREHQLTRPGRIQGYDAKTPYRAPKTRGVVRKGGPVLLKLHCGVQ